MKYTTSILIISICLLSISCKKKERQAPATSLNEMVDTSAMLMHTGSFSSGPYGTTSGMAEIYQQGTTYLVKLANFSTSNGPALHVYLSKEAMPINYVDLGNLKSISGNQVYNISGMPDFSQFKYISIHCVQYNHLFGSATLN
jgi:hypothetical protein